MQPTGLPFLTFNKIFTRLDFVTVPCLPVINSNAKRDAAMFLIAEF
jgi:hypothetical protein